MRALAIFEGKSRSTGAVSTDIHRQTGDSKYSNLLSRRPPHDKRIVHSILWDLCGIFWDNHPAFCRLPAEHPKASPSFAAQGLAAQ